MQKNMSISYKTVTVAVLLMSVTAMNAMENQGIIEANAGALPELKKSSESWSLFSWWNKGEKESTTSEIVSSQELGSLSQSILLAAESEEKAVESLAKVSSKSFFSYWSDLVFGADSNVLATLNKGNLTKEMVAQDLSLQERAREGIEAAIKGKKIENLCNLIKELNKFEMLGLYVDQNEAVTQCMNAEITVVCQQKNYAKLIDMLTVMKMMQLTVDSSLHDSINEVLNDKKDQDLNIFKNINQKNKELVSTIKNELKKSQEQYKNPLLEAKNIVLLQHYLAGEVTEVEPKQIKEKLNLTDDEKKLNAIMKALGKFIDEK
jgi:hypothetical protein